MEPLVLDPHRGMKVTAMLADYAVVTPDGKLTVVGAGWTSTTPTTAPFAVALLVDVPWHLTNQRHTIRMELIDLDGVPVTPIGDEEPKRIEMQFEVGRPPGARPGSSITLPCAFQHGPMTLSPDSHYEWRILVNGEAHEDWRLAFSTRPEVQSNAA